MNMRQKMKNKRLDKKVYKRTARKMHKKNLIVTNMRGGIRL